jgi:hypothetical protein
MRADIDICGEFIVPFACRRQVEHDYAKVDVQANRQAKLDDGEHEGGGHGCEA